MTDDRENIVSHIKCPLCGKNTVTCRYWESGGDSRYFYDNFTHHCTNPRCDYHEEELERFGGESSYEYPWPSCPFCGRDALAGEPPQVVVSEEAKKKRLYEQEDFDEKCGLLVNDFEQISREMIEYFSNHPDELYRLEWRKFEELLAAIFRNQGYVTELGPGWGDGGIDLRLIQKDSIGRMITLVQAKKYKPEIPIRLEAVAALYGIVEHEKANRGLFVTTSKYLPGAREFAAKQSYKLSLATSAEVAEWCKNICGW
ncbi:MAG: restriction endonuclease [Spirochaetales bacterium]|nr:restriction endonuclease [Spirochaetales bacterium]